jgi:hypothetical protein
VRLQRLTHDAQVFGRGAAAAADDPRAGIQGQAGVLGPQVGGAVASAGAVHEWRNAAVRLGDQNRRRIRRRGKIDDGCDQFRGADAAIAAACGEVVAPVQRGQPASFSLRNAAIR